MNFSNGFKTQLCIYSEAITDPGLDVGALAIVDPAVPAHTNMGNIAISLHRHRCHQASNPCLFQIILAQEQSSSRLESSKLTAFVDHE